MFSSKISQYFLMIFEPAYLVIQILVARSSLTYYLIQDKDILCSAVCTRSPKQKVKLKPNPPPLTLGSLPSLCVVNYRAGLSTPVLRLLDLIIYMFSFVFVQKLIVFYLWRRKAQLYIIISITVFKDQCYSAKKMTGHS